MRKTNRKNEAEAQGGLIKTSGCGNRTDLALAVKRDAQCPGTAMTITRMVSDHQGTRQVTRRLWWWCQWALMGEWSLTAGGKCQHLTALARTPGPPTYSLWDCGRIAPAFWAMDAISAKWKSSPIYSITQQIFTDHLLCGRNVLQYRDCSADQDWQAPSPASGADIGIESWVRRSINNGPSLTLSSSIPLHPLEADGIAVASPL